MSLFGPKSTHTICKDLMTKINKSVRYEQIEKKDLEKIKGALSDELNQIARLVGGHVNDFGKPNASTLMADVAGVINNLIGDLKRSADYLYLCRDKNLKAEAGVLRRIVNALNSFRNNLIMPKPGDSFKNSDAALASFTDGVVKPFRSEFLPIIDLAERKVDYEINLHTGTGFA